MDCGRVCILNLRSLPAMAFTRLFGLERELGTLASLV